jgi:hypothetical protein
MWIPSDGTSLVRIPRRDMISVTDFAENKTVQRTRGMGNAGNAVVARAACSRKISALEGI